MVGVRHVHPERRRTAHHAGRAHVRRAAVDQVGEAAESADVQLVGAASVERHVRERGGGDEAHAAGVSRAVRTDGGHTMRGNDAAKHSVRERRVAVVDAPGRRDGRHDRGVGGGVREGRDVQHHRARDERSEDHEEAVARAGAGSFDVARRGGQ